MSVITIVIIVIAVLFFAFLLYGAFLNAKAAEKLKEEGFAPNITIGRLQIDERSRLWTLSGLSVTYSLDDIVDCAVIEDGVSYKSDHGVLRTVVGGTLFGAVGAVVGASTASSSEYINSMEVAIWTKDAFQNRPAKISLINTRTSKNSMTYKISKENAESIVNIIDKYSGFSERKKAAEKNVTLPQAPAQVSTADDLGKYKKLLDEGAITEEEYSKIKEKILSEYIEH